MNNEIIAASEEQKLKGCAGDRPKWKGFFIHKDFIVYFDSLNDAVIFNILVYWHCLSKDGKPRAKIERDGYLWVAKSYYELAQECGVKERTVRSSIARIKQQELVEVKVWKFNGRPVNHFRIIWEKVAELMPNITKDFKTNLTSDVISICHEHDLKSDKKRQVDLTSGVRSLTSNTAINTTKNTTSSINLLETNLDDDEYYEAINHFCRIFGCSSSEIISELARLKPENRIRALRLSEKSILNYEKEIRVMAKFALQVVRNKTSDILLGKEEKSSGVNLDKTISSLVGRLQWLDSQRISTLLDKYGVCQVSALSHEQKEDFCGFLENLIKA